MANIQASLKASSWKKFFLDIKSLDYSDKMLPEITASANPDLPPGNIFETISKNPGIGLLCLVTDCESITMFHNPGVIGGSWFNSDRKLVALLGLQRATAIKIKESSISAIKQRVPKLEEVLDWIQSKKPLKDMPSRGLTELFHFKNIIPVPVSLVHAFIQLEKFDPDLVAQALLSAMTNSKTDDSSSSDDSLSVDSSSESSSSGSISSEREKNRESNTTPKGSSSPKSPSDTITPKTRSRRQPRIESPKIKPH